MNAPIPRVPLLLGAGGLLPFLVLALMLWALPAAYTDTAVTWLLAYSAVILCFVGALHWGVALVHPEMGDTERGLLMVWSVVPALVAWVALALPPLVGMLVMLAMFTVQLVADHILVRHFPVTPWFLHLRQRLTVVVVVCLALAATYLGIN
tara:strand:- start:408 stop:860 length:453 start_codon:yes stop_codon:yes gene_type:complete